MQARLKSALAVLMMLLVFGASAQAAIYNLTCAQASTALACHPDNIAAHETSHLHTASMTETHGECCEPTCMPSTPKPAAIEGTCCSMTFEHPAPLSFSPETSRIGRFGFILLSLAHIPQMSTADPHSYRKPTENPPFALTRIDPLFLAYRV